ncbi:hypothetical protein C8J55DRAFT_560957 [Lentinula edodes]|uniref:Uncharacterized protein n=1 Tax=Lentinula lateritia TaxID=40482 RepID=A0A9W9ADZ5_9AGAR|nr:hypothetical protein C8J55DRAFT_560957 [Lentinula edodes]
MSTPDSALFSDLQVILRASRQQTSPESQVLANSIKSVRDSLFHNPVWQAITQGPFPSTLEGSHNDWAAVGVFIFATLALHIIEDPSHTPMTIGCRRRVLSNLPTTLTNPVTVSFSSTLRPNSIPPLSSACFLQEGGGCRSWRKPVQGIRSIPDKFSKRHPQQTGLGEYPQKVEEYELKLCSLNPGIPWKIKENTRKRYKANSWQFPLQFALSSSVLLLLRPVALQSTSPDRRHLLQLAHALGPYEERPSYFQKLERWLWRNLISVSNGERTSVEILHEFFETFRFSQEEISEDDRDYFYSVSPIPGQGLLQDVVESGHCLANSLAKSPLDHGHEGKRSDSIDGLETAYTAYQTSLSTAISSAQQTVESKPDEMDVNPPPPPSTHTPTTKEKSAALEATEQSSPVAAEPAKNPVLGHHLPNDITPKTTTVKRPRPTMEDADDEGDPTPSKRFRPTIEDAEDEGDITPSIGDEEDEEDLPPSERPRPSIRFRPPIHEDEDEDGDDEDKDDYTLAKRHRRPSRQEREDKEDEEDDEDDLGVGGV